MLKGVQKALRFGEARKIRELETVVASVNEREPEVLKLSDAELAAKTPEFQKRYDAGETLEELLPETFAVVR